MASFGFQQGCTGLIVQRAKTPAEVIRRPPQIVRRTTPYEIKKEVVAEKMEIVSTTPPGVYPELKLGARPVSPVEKNTVAKLQEVARKMGQVIFVTKGKILLDTLGGDKKWYRGWVPEGTIFLAKKRKKQRN